MTIAHQVTYRDLDSSDALNSTIAKRLEKLERYSSKILHRRVVLDVPHNHKNKGKMFRAIVELEVQGKTITVNQCDASIHVAIRDAFNVLERRVKACSEQKQVRRRKISHGAEAAYDEFSVAANG